MIMSTPLPQTFHSLQIINSKVVYRLLLSASFLFSMLQLEGQFVDPSELPEVEDYIFVRTNPNADTIIIALHGGPSDELFEGSFNHFEWEPNFSVVEMLKYEMMHEVLYNDSLTLEQGYAVNDTTVAMIEKVVQHYNAQDKVVVVAGHSWGALVMGEYLDDYGTESVHKIIPMEGRLSVQPEFVDILLEGYLPTFDTDGMTILIEGTIGEFPHGLLTLGAAAFANDWVDSLQNEDLSKMMYTYSEFDRNTGALREKETNFLDESGATTLFIPGGTHGSVFSDMYMAEVIAFIRGDNPTSLSEPILVDGLKLFPTLADDLIQLEHEKSGGLMIFDMNGVVVKQLQVAERQVIDVSDMAVGSYMAIHRDDSGQARSARFQVWR